MNIYPILRHITISRLKTDNADLSINLEVPHLVVGLVLPENTEQIQKDFNKINLRPYELAVNTFFNGDFRYDLSQVRQPEQRTFTGISQVIDDLNSTGDNFPIIIAYLQFPTS